jgi:UDPglucose 6-dehydrogenase
MKIGFLGAGILGLPMAITFASRGHCVRVCDIDPRRMNFQWYPPHERGANGESLEAMAAQTDFAFGSHDDVISKSEIIFITVPTPSARNFDGTKPYPTSGVDYELSMLESALTRVVEGLEHVPVSNRIFAIVSTVVPGTIRRIVGKLPLWVSNKIAHTPAFSAVGNVVKDWLHPEFNLIGAADVEVGERLKSLFETINAAPTTVTTIENAELIKTSYNGYIGIKIGFANAVMELAHKTPGCDVDVVVDCLSLATKRLISTSYLRGGLGDGGGCHPKDNSALGALAGRLDLSYDPFGNNMTSRDQQTDWLASLIEAEVHRTDLPVWLLGTAFKANVSVEFGSPALLLLDAIERRGLTVFVHDPLVPGRDRLLPTTPAIFIMAVAHDGFAGFLAAPGSVVVDPHRRIAKMPGVRLVSIGRSELASE